MLALKTENWHRTSPRELDVTEKSDVTAERPDCGTNDPRHRVKPDVNATLDITVESAKSRNNNDPYVLTMMQGGETTKTSR